MQVRSLTQWFSGWKGRGRRKEGEEAARLRRSQLPDPIRIAPYIGYGSPERVRLQGRIVEEEGLIPCEQADTVWKNLGNLYRRFDADEQPGVRVRAEWNDVRAECVSDIDGYFRFDFAPPSEITAGWKTINLSLPDLSGPAGEVVAASGNILIPSPEAQFGVISDLDDTVLRTNVTKRVRMLATVALRNARTRVPFPGVAAFYRALSDGRAGNRINPVFYVSTCPWNFFELLTEFFRIHDIPSGPMMLKDYRLRTLLLERASKTHKLASIRTLLDFYPSLPFVLIGDSGEHDPEIYAEIVRSYPGRILAVYIRNVTSRLSRAEAIDRLANELNGRGCPLVLAQDTELAAYHAARSGLMNPAALDEIRVARRLDLQAPRQARLAT